MTVLIAARYRARMRRKKMLRDRLADWPLEENCWVYLLLSEYGELYVGQTNNLRWRLREHHSEYNRCPTRGQQWRYLAVIPVRTRRAALSLERLMHVSRAALCNWVDGSEARMAVLEKRYGFPRPKPSQMTHLSRRRANMRLPPNVLSDI